MLWLSQININTQTFSTIHISVRMIVFFRSPNKYMEDGVTWQDMTRNLSFIFNKSGTLFFFFVNLKINLQK